MYPEWQSEKGSNSSHSKQNPSNDHSTPKKNIISCLYIIGLLIYVAVMATLLSYSWNLLQLHKQTDEFYYANQVAFEWKKGTHCFIQVSSQTSSSQLMLIVRPNTSMPLSINGQALVLAVTVSLRRI